MKSIFKWIGASVVLLALSVILPGSASAVPIVLSDNLSTSSSFSFSEYVSETRWIAASFGTDGNSYTLDEITLRMVVQYATGTPILNLYSDAAGKPGAALGTLVAPASFTTGTHLLTFGGNGLMLSPSTTYWAVLSAIVAGADTQDFNWKYTDNTAGSGVGFQTASADSPNSGVTWTTYTDYPQYMRVVASTSAVPESLNTLTGLLAAGLGLAGLAKARLLRVRP